MGFEILFSLRQMKKKEITVNGISIIGGREG